jgi:hypothetical protein
MVRGIAAQFLRTHYQAMSNVLAIMCLMASVSLLHGAQQRLKRLARYIIQGLILQLSKL